MVLLIFFSSVAVLAWIYLLAGHHGFWRAMPRLEQSEATMTDPPPIAVVMPARDEAESVEAAVRSLLAQDYPGRLQIVVVDDQSVDSTGAIVDTLMLEAGPERDLERIVSTDRPAGWSGKLWAVKTGLDHLEARRGAPAIILLTDADIAHDPANLSSLFKKMVNDDLDLFSVMVRLRCRSIWERLLIPPFIFFFQMLYPFPAVNKPDSALAAAAGGCVLLRRDALMDAGGIEAIRGALIDDVALARLIKSRPGGGRRIWLGHAERTTSLRAYDGLSSIWQMVARTADIQLRHSLLNLCGTAIGMATLYLVPPLAALSWPLHRDPLLGLLGLAAWLMMAAAFLPTLRLYRRSFLWALTLPLAALLYTGMTIDSARRYRAGKGGLWKGRVFEG